MRTPRVDSAGALLGWQRTLGNQATLHLLRGSRPVGPPHLAVQRCGDIPCDCSPQERAARLDQTPTMPAQPVQREVVVEDPTARPRGAPASKTNAAIVRDYVEALCPAFTVSGAAVVPTSASACPAPGSESCGCLCDMHQLTDPATGAPVRWTIVIDDTTWPMTDETARTVTVQSPYSRMRFGAWAKGPPSHRITEPGWLILGHELCGHAHLFARGTHPRTPATASGRPGHDATVQIENRIATEHGIPPGELRGLFADPHHGESFARISVSGFPNASADVTRLPPAERQNLGVALAFINSASVKMDVIGHSDRHSTNPARNLQVSQQRADAVKAYLTGRGVSPSRFLVTQGVADGECALPGEQAQCRSVDIFMYMFASASASSP